MPFVPGLPGSNPRMHPPQGRPAHMGDPQGHGDHHMGQGVGSRPSGMSRYQEKGPSSVGSGRRVPLRVEKVNDKMLQSRLIYGNV